MSEQEAAFRNHRKQHWSLPSNSKRFKCGYCGDSVATDLGWLKSWSEGFNGPSYSRDIRICPTCQYPTVFVDWKEEQVPLPLAGKRFSLNRDDPNDLKTIVHLYNQARFGLSRAGATGPVLILRKLLMHIAVQQGAVQKNTFAHYCDYLKTANIVSKPQHDLLERIRKSGNTENHEITVATDADANDLLSLMTLLIESIYFAT